MAEVTIGIPVYNGQDQLVECLDCLVNQTFSDFEILLFDNASTDETEAIAKRFAALDSRIRYTRRSENIGAVKNFITPLEQAKSPFFMWRAHDDVSSLDYIEKLVAALKRAPSAALATGTIQFERPNGRPTRDYVPAIPIERGLSAILKLMFGSHAGWYYGIWRTKTLQFLIGRVWTEFPYAWASDHLTLYSLLLDQQVTAAPDTKFIQRVTPKAHGPRTGQRQPIPELLELRREFLKCCNAMVDERAFDPFTKLAIKTANHFYVGKRVYPMKKIIKRTLFRY
ncbi:glycosyltransferase family 2 protein [Labrys sp. ZIDIC5]|uniref:glycosyltransferase family 2 protein n=1 Tax=Labrys sedimenti TaxID=3106036 RepID=UPI002ACA5AC0|nr:glycosyltransferase family 2 protein [Labrys sp. ZIDIC5]MDZ5453244.1 glycosyltransferase family 2 protein [Labrys sp. ZIDIC5]